MGQLRHSGKNSDKLACQMCSGMVAHGQLHRLCIHKGKRFPDKQEKQKGLTS